MRLFWTLLCFCVCCISDFIPVKTLDEKWVHIMIPSLGECQLGRSLSCLLVSHVTVQAGENSIVYSILNAKSKWQKRGTRGKYLRIWRTWLHDCKLPALPSVLPSNMQLTHNKLDELEAWATFKHWDKDLSLRRFGTFQTERTHPPSGDPPPHVENLT